MRSYAILEHYSCSLIMNTTDGLLVDTLFKHLMLLPLAHLRRGDTEQFVHVHSTELFKFSWHSDTLYHYLKHLFLKFQTELSHGSCSGSIFHLNESRLESETLRHPWVQQGQQVQGRVGHCHRMKWSWRWIAYSC